MFHTAFVSRTSGLASIDLTDSYKPLTCFQCTSSNELCRDANQTDLVTCDIGQQFCKVGQAGSLLLLYRNQKCQLEKTLFLPEGVSNRVPHHGGKHGLPRVVLRAVVCHRVQRLLCHNGRPHKGQSQDQPISNHTFLKPELSSVQVTYCTSCCQSDRCNTDNHASQLSTGVIKIGLMMAASLLFLLSDIQWRFSCLSKCCTDIFMKMGDLRSQLCMAVRRGKDVEILMVLRD